MNSFGVKIGRSFRIDGDSLIPSREQMQETGQAVVDSELDRMSRGINANDQPAKPLNPRYEKRKLNVGASPIRDNRLTGETLASFGVLEAADGFARVGFSSESAEIKAERTQRIEPMVGLSPNDAQAPIKKAHEHFAANVKDSVIQK
jgi:hypothetical protein